METEDEGKGKEKRIEEAGTNTYKSRFLGGIQPEKERRKRAFFVGIWQKRYFFLQEIMKKYKEYIHQKKPVFSLKRKK